MSNAFDRGGVEDTRLEAMAKHTKKIRGQEQPFRRQTLSRPRTGMLEAKVKDQEHNAEVISKKKVFAQKFINFPQNLGVPPKKRSSLPKFKRSTEKKCF